jgi:hypothetical protein
MSIEVVRFKEMRQYNQKVVGESNYQDALEQIAADYENVFIDTVELLLEDKNKYDSNAVAVTVDGETVGYLSRDDAVKYRQRLAELNYTDIIGVCVGKLIGGGEDKSYGIVLDLDLDNFEVKDSYIPSSKIINTQPAKPPQPAKNKNSGCLGCLTMPFRVIADIGNSMIDPKTRRSTFILIGVLLLVCLAACMFSLTSSSPNPVAPAPASSTSVQNTVISPTAVLNSTRCVPASAQQIDNIRTGVKGIQQSNDVKSVFAVRSKDYEKVWFVAAEITGPSIQPKQAIGLWAISGDLEAPKITLSVDGFALQFSDWGDGTKTDAQLSQFDDGAQEAIECAKQQ